MTPDKATEEKIITGKDHPHHHLYSTSLDDALRFYEADKKLDLSERKALFRTFKEMEEAIPKFVVALGILTVLPAARTFAPQWYKKKPFLTLGAGAIVMSLLAKKPVEWLAFKYELYQLRKVENNCYNVMKELEDKDMLKSMQYYEDTSKDLSLVLQDPTTLDQFKK